MELGASVAEALLASAESAEVLSGLGDDVVVEGEVDAAGASCEAVRSALIGNDGRPMSIWTRWFKWTSVNGGVTYGQSSPPWR